MTTPTTEQWRTGISDVRDSCIRYRGVDVATLIESSSLESVIALVLFGRAIDGETADALRRALVAAADHGVASPSIATARIVASTRGPAAAAIGAGLVAFGGPAHGGAAEGAATCLTRALDRVALGESPDAAVAVVIADLAAKGERTPGYGHPLHTVDPRVEPLLRAPLWRRDHRDLVLVFEEQLLRRSPRLRANADAAVAALLLDAGCNPGDVSVITAIGRTIGLAAHVREEWTREDPFRAPGPGSITYDGPQQKDQL